MLPRIKGAMNNQKNFPVTVAFSLAWTLSQPDKGSEPLEGVTGMLWPLDPPPLKMLHIYIFYKLTYVTNSKYEHILVRTYE